MRSGHCRKISNQVRALVVLALFYTPLAGFSQQTEPAAGQDPAVAEEAFRIEAEMHHKMALLYLKNGEVDKGMAEARQIIHPPIPPKFELAVAESMSFITDELAKARRFDLAQALLDEAFKATVQIPPRVSILQTKARIYLAAGDDDKAIEAWKRAKELEGRIRS